MFYVTNKDKLISFAVALSTVVILLFFAGTIKTNDENVKIVKTNASVSKQLPIYSVNTEEPKVALTINCAWDAKDIDLILETLKNNEVKCTFFIVGEWARKKPRSCKENK